MKEPVKEKTFGEKVQESFPTAVMSAGIVLAVLALLWIPFKVIPAIYSSGSNFVATTLSSTFIPATTSVPATTCAPATTSAPATATVQTLDSKDSSTTPTVSTTYSFSQPAPVYSGVSDLQISLIGTGIIDPTTKQFVQTNYVGFNDDIGIKFQVKNIGTNISGPWMLRINSPSRTTPTYDSPSQISIKPGDMISFVASYDSPISTGVNTAYITVDPLGKIIETSKANNQIIVPIQIQDLSYSYNNNYNYGTTAISPSPYGTIYSWTNINANCHANPQTARVGDPITWYVAPTGGNGYFTYSWSGSDYLNSNSGSNQNSIIKTYYYSGIKTASVTVVSNGQSVTTQCSVQIY